MGAQKSKGEKNLEGSPKKFIPHFLGKMGDKREWGQGLEVIPHGLGSLVKGLSNAYSKNCSWLGIGYPRKKYWQKWRFFGKNGCFGQKRGKFSIFGNFSKMLLFSLHSTFRPKLKSIVFSKVWTYCGSITQRLGAKGSIYRKSKISENFTKSGFFSVFLRYFPG